MDRCPVCFRPLKGGDVCPRCGSFRNDCTEELRIYTREYCGEVKGGNPVEAAHRNAIMAVRRYHDEQGRGGPPPPDERILDTSSMRWKWTRS